jgi:hypothetical protein
MAKKKGSAQDRTNSFLSGFGTAGGGMGAPGLTMFGAGDAQRQVIYGMTDNYGAMRDPAVNDSPMPQDLESSYLKLNLPGSPLPMNGLSSTQNLNASINNQKMFLAQYQMSLAQMMPPAAFQQLPVGYPPAKKK